MKVIKIKIQRTHPRGIEGGTSYVYPPQYKAKKVVFGPDYEPGAKDRGQDYQWIVVGVRDYDAHEFLSANGYVAGGFNFEAVELNDTEADIQMDEWHPDLAPIKTSDQDKVNEILSKLALGKTLDKSDEAALDPDKPEIGLNRGRSWKEALGEAKQKF